MSDFQLRYATAATIEFYPPKGRPTSASSTGYYAGAYSAGASTLWTSTAVTLDTASQSVSSLSAGDTTITVTSTTGFVAGRRYWMAPTGGDGFGVVVRRIPSATTLLLDAPLREAVTAGTISSHRLTFAITTTHTASVRRKCRVEWAVVTSGVTDYYSQFFDIVLYPFDLTLTEGDLEQAYPGFGDLAGADSTWRKLADGAVVHVRNVLLGRQIQADLVRERELLKEAAVFRTLYMWALGSPQSTAQSLAERWDGEYKAALQRFYDSHAWYDTDDDMIADLGLGYQQVYIDGHVVLVEDPEAYGTEDGPPVHYAQVG